MKRGLEQGYLTEPAKSLFISDTLGKEEAAKRDFSAEGLTLNCFSGSQYLGAYLGPRYQLEAWVKPQMEAWSHEVRVLGKIARRNP